MLTEQNDLKNWLTHLISEAVNTDKGNSLQTPSNEKIWEKPLVGFSKGEDPYYQFFKEDIGEFFCTPIELFKEAFPGWNITPSELTVISWVLPHTHQIKSDHRMESTFPSERWSRSRLFGEEFNNYLRATISEVLTNAGYPAIAPMLSPSFRCETSAKYGYASTWSERHAAFVCGLGTFGLSDGLITSVGKAVRFGSVVAKMDIPPTPRPYQHHNAYCLFYQTGKCGKCIKRCPADAISRNGHDKIKCREYIQETITPYINSTYRLETKACGLCQVKVPCESRIPVRSSDDISS